MIYLLLEIQLGIFLRKLEVYLTYNLYVNLFNFIMYFGGYLKF